MKKITVFVLACYMLLFGVGCGNGLAQRDTSEKEEQTEVFRGIDFELTDITGRTFRLSDYSGKIIILNFFATWCPPCRMEMPDFNEISQTYKADVEIIAINVGEALPKVKEFAKQLNLMFTIAPDNGKVSDAYGPIRSIPVTVIIGKDFNIARRYIGARSKEVFIQDIESLK